MGTDAQRAAECERCAAQFDSDSGPTVASWPGSKSLHHRSLPALVHARPRDKFSALPTSSDANLVNSRFDLPALWFLTSALPSTTSGLSYKTKNEGSRGIPVLRGEKAGEIGPRPSPRKGNGRAAGAGRALGAHLNTRALTLKNWLTQTLGLEIYR